MSATQFASGKIGGLRGPGGAVTPDLQALHDQAVSAATLAGHYSNDNTDTPIPGEADTTKRGARWWSGLAQTALTSMQAIVAALNFEIGANRFLFGRRVMFARAGSLYGLGDAITEDGYHFPGKWTVRGINGVVAARNPLDGFLEIDAGATAFSVLTLSGGGRVDNSVQRYYDGLPVFHAEADAGFGASAITTKDGTKTIPKLASPFILSPALDTPNFVYHAARDATTRRRTVTRTAKTTGVRSVATPTASDAWGHRLSFDGSKLLYLTNRNGPAETYWQALDGSKTGGAVEHPVSVTRWMLGLGNSIMALGWAQAVAGNFAATIVSPLGASVAPGGPTSGGGIGSQQAWQIAYRYGAGGFGQLPPLTCSLAGNTMAAGANQLTALSNKLLSRASDAAGAVRTLRASILGIAGLLTSTQSPTNVAGSFQSDATDFYTYTFTPDAGQTPPSVVPAGTTLTIDPENRQDAVLLCDLMRNDVGSLFARSVVNLSANPAPGDTLKLTVNGVVTVLTFSASAGAGLVQIGANVAATCTNLANYIGANFTNTADPVGSGAAALTAAAGASNVTITAVSGLTYLTGAAVSTAITIAQASAYGWYEIVRAAYDAVYQAYKPLVRRIIFYGGTNTTSEYATAGGASQQNYFDIVAANAALSAIYTPLGSWIDPRPLYNQGSSNDTPMDSSDGLHPAQAAQTRAWINPTITFITNAGWYA